MWAKRWRCAPLAASNKLLPGRIWTVHLASLEPFPGRQRRIQPRAKVTRGRGRVTAARRPARPWLLGGEDLRGSYPIPPPQRGRPSALSNPRSRGCGASHFRGLTEAGCTVRLWAGGRAVRKRQSSPFLLPLPPTRPGWGTVRLCRTEISTVGRWRCQNWASGSVRRHLACPGRTGTPDVGPGLVLG